MRSIAHFFFHYDYLYIYQWDILCFMCFRLFHVAQTLPGQYTAHRALDCTTIERGQKLLQGCTTHCNIQTPSKVSYSGTILAEGKYLQLCWRERELVLFNTSQDWVPHQTSPVCLNRTLGLWTWEKKKNPYGKTHCLSVCKTRSVINMQITYTNEELSPPGFCNFIDWKQQRLQFIKS